MIEEQPEMQHEVYYDELDEIVLMRLAGKVSAQEYELMADMVNAIPGEKRKRFLVDSSGFYKPPDDERDLPRRFAEKVTMKDTRAAILSTIPHPLAVSRTLLNLFTGDYQVRFFTEKILALRWLKENNGHRS